MTVVGPGRGTNWGESTIRVGSLCPTFAFILRDYLVEERRAAVIFIVS